jgi:hypothetical protein
VEVNGGWKRLLSEERNIFKKYYDIKSRRIISAGHVARKEEA